MGQQNLPFREHLDGMESVLEIFHYLRREISLVFEFEAGADGAARDNEFSRFDDALPSVEQKHVFELASLALSRNVYANHSQHVFRIALRGDQETVNNLKSLFRTFINLALKPVDSDDRVTGCFK